jgi:formylglycine-generating enzyme required for sulfatase activity
LSYARVDKPYCVQIAGVLKIHEVWLDDRLYAGQRWWQEIMRRLEWCEGFLYLLSHDSIQSQYCRREFELAREKGKHIFPVLIQPDVVLPDELLDMQYADLSGGLTGEGVSVLLNAIHLAERATTAATNQQTHVPPRRPAPPPPSTTPPTPPADPMAVIGKAADAMENGQFDEAVFMLKRAMEQGLRSRFIDIEALLREAEAHLEWQTRQREMEREYNYIAELAKRTRTRKLGCEAFLSFQRDFPNYDPDNIADLCAFEQAETVAESSANPVRAFRSTIALLEWCDISSGVLPIVSGKNGHAHADTLHVESFFMSKYPVTNYQFQMFVDDPTGYANPRWWDFSQFARAWRMENPEPLPSQFQGDDRPRENVTWYEAMAFCNWLSEKIDWRVTLPTRQQWQRAAKGDDNRVYPWGSEFDASACNTRESRIRQTTLVMRYANGISPFSVFDLAGNVWEWCLNGNYEECDITTNVSRAVQGGSYISAHERAQTNFHFVLSPEYHYGSIGFRLVCDGR